MPYTSYYNQNESKGGNRIHTQEHNAATTRTNAKKRAQQQNDRVTTQKMRSTLSLSLSLKHFRGVVVESRSCNVLKVCLVSGSIHLGVPFIAPRGLGAVEVPFGRPSLPSICGCTRLSGAHRTMKSTRAENRMIGWFPVLGAPTVRQGHRIVRCSS